MIYVYNLRTKKTPRHQFSTKNCQTVSKNRSEEHTDRQDIYFVKHALIQNGAQKLCDQENHGKDLDTTKQENECKEGVKLKTTCSVKNRPLSPTQYFLNNNIKI